MGLGKQLAKLVRLERQAEQCSSRAETMEIIRKADKVNCKRAFQTSITCSVMSEYPGLFA